MNIGEQIAYYRKGIVAIVGVLLTWAAANNIGWIPDFLTTEYVDSVLGALTALLVILVPNGPKPEGSE